MTIEDAVASLGIMGGPVDENVVEEVWERYERYNPPVPLLEDGTPDFWADPTFVERYHRAAEDRSPTVV